MPIVSALLRVLFRAARGVVLEVPVKGFFDLPARTRAGLSDDFFDTFDRCAVLAREVLDFVVLRGYTFAVHDDSVEDLTLANRVPKPRRSVHVVEVTAEPRSLSGFCTPRRCSFQRGAMDVRTVPKCRVVGSVADSYTYLAPNCSTLL